MGVRGSSPRNSTRDHPAILPQGRAASVDAAALRPLGFVAPRLFGLVPHGYDTVLDNLIHLTLGVLGVAIGLVIGPRSAPFRVR